MYFTSALRMSRPLPKSPESITPVDVMPQSPTEPIDKDIRAWEHDRQRVRKVADTVKMRARKEQGWINKLPDSRRNSGVTWSSEKTDVVGPLDRTSLSENRGSYPAVTPSEPRIEVKLADLVTTRKPRKKADSDFEFIPHVRSVIVLDDQATPDVALDEPWEHVYGEDDVGESSPIPSYAKIVSSTK